MPLIYGILLHRWPIIISNAISDYMRVHFQDEEEYMLSIGFPELEEHKQLHKDIIENLAQIIHTPAKLGIIKSKMRVVSKRVLIDHIIYEDSKIKLFQVMKEEGKKTFDITDL